MAPSSRITLPNKATTGSESREAGLKPVPKTGGASEDDGLSARTSRRFADVLANVRFDRIPKFLESIRRGRLGEDSDFPGSMSKLKISDRHPKVPTKKQQELTCSVQQPPLNGVYNLVYRVQFSDGVNWALKIPRRGHSAEWTTLAARSLVSEAGVMQLLKRETTIPVPEIYAFDATIDNLLGCPFLAMEWIEAMSLDNYWDVNAPSPEKFSTEQRVLLLQDLAAAVVQLDRFRFESCGMPVFKNDGSIEDVGTTIFAECNADETVSGPLIEAGPFTTCAQFLNWKVDRFAAHLSDNLDKAGVEMFRLFTSWIHQATEEPECFVLAHRDLGPQNILVNDQGRLCGIIDWEMAAILPECLGNGKNGSFPHWLARDYDAFRGHRSSSDQTVTSDWIDPEHEYFEFKLEQAGLSGLAPSLFSNKGEDDEVDSEELDFYRTVWRLCVENSTNNGTRRRMSIEEILAVVPRTYATGLTSARSLDARILLKAAEYPDQNLRTIIASIMRQIARVRCNQLQELNEDVQDLVMTMINHDDTVLRVFADNGIPGLSTPINPEGQLMNTHPIAVPASYGDAAIAMTPPSSFGADSVNSAGSSRKDFPPFELDYDSEEFTPPQSPETSELPFTLDGSTVNTDAPSRSAPSSMTSSIIESSSDGYERTSKKTRITGGADEVDLVNATTLQNAKDTSSEIHKGETGADIKAWFMYLYAGMPPKLVTGGTDQA